MTNAGNNIINPEKWITNHGDYLYNFAMGRVFSTALAEDLIQDTFFSALKNRTTFRGDSSERTWLISILKRKIIDHFRKKSTQKVNTILDDDTPFRKEGILKGHWEDVRGPSGKFLEDNSTLDNEEFMKALNICLSKLPTKLAMIFSMKIMDEMDTIEICKEINITPSNIWTSLHRCRLRLRECIEKIWFR
jgi:RNA polymerase sigma-70 factor (ECF subfamily)